MAPDFLHLRFDRPTAHIACVLLSRPNAANALSAALLDELSVALDLIESDDDIRVWMLGGADRPDGSACFSAGVDIKEVLAGPVKRGVDPAALVDRIDDSLKPSIVVINGVCTTGALELALACDLRIAGHSARISDWHLKRTGLGIGAWGSATRLSRLVGVNKAKELVLLGEEVDGAEAARIGLVNKAVPDAELADAALGMASTIAALPARGVRTTLGFLQLQAELSKHEALHLAGQIPALMGVTLRPITDAAERFAREAKR